MKGRFLAGGAALIAGTVIQAVAGLAASLYLARTLGPDAFGRFAVVLASAGMTLSLLSFHVGILITRTPETEFDRRRRETYFAAITIETVLGGLATVLFVAFVERLSPWDILLIGSQCLLHWTTTNRAYFERSMPYTRLAIIETSTITLSYILAVSLAAGGAGAAALYVREAFTAGLLTLVLWMAGGLTFHRLQIPDIGAWRQLFRESRQLWIEGLLEGSFHRLTIIAAQAIGGDRQSGYLFMAQSLAMRPHQFLSPATSRVASNWFRTVSDPATRREGLHRLLRGAGSLLVLVSAAIALFADPVVPMLLGDQWYGAVPALMALLGVVLFQTPFEILRSYSMVTGRTGLVLRARLSQYLGFAAVLSAGLLLDMSSVALLGACLSAGIIAAFATLWHGTYRPKVS